MDNSITTEGRDIAIAMLLELTNDADTQQACSLEEQYRPARPQYNILQTYLDRVRGKRELEEGFTEVLSDFISSSVGGAVPDADFYEELVHGQEVGHG